jgi:hypothetical protein
MTKDDSPERRSRLLDAMATPPALRGTLDLPNSWRRYLLEFSAAQSFCAALHLEQVCSAANSSARRSLPLAACFAPSYRDGGTAALTGPRRGFETACGQLSRYWLPWSRAIRLSFDVQAPGGVEILVNRRCEMTLPPTREWKRVRLDIGARPTGINLELVWSDCANETLASLLRAGWRGEPFSLALGWGRLGPNVLSE